MDQHRELVRCQMCHQDILKENFISGDIEATQSDRKIRDVFSDIMNKVVDFDVLCERCFKLLDLVVTLEAEIRLKKNDVLQIYKSDEKVSTLNTNLVNKHVNVTNEFLEKSPIVTTENNLSWVNMPEESNVGNQNMRSGVDLDMPQEFNEIETSEVTIELVEPPKKKKTSFLTSADLKCQLCQRPFDKRRYLMDHLRRVHQSSIHQCRGCNSRFKYRDEVLTHQTNCLEFKKVMTAEKHVDKKLEEAHKLMARGKVNNQCKDCGGFFLTRSLLATHRANQHQGHIQPQDILENNCVDETKVEDPVRCTLCGIMVNNAYALAIHQGSVHGVERPWVCQLCGKSFSRHLELDNHRRVHSGEKPFQCEICGGRFNQKQNLHTHVRHVHLRERRYNCDICDKKFRRKRLLDCHINSKHNNERPYQCKLCSATFVYPEHVKKHELSHTSGGDQLKCGECDKIFRGKTSLDNHMTTHRPDTSFQCLGCPLYFRTRDLLVEHFRTSGHHKGVLSSINKPDLEIVDQQETLTLSFMEEEGRDKGGPVYEDVVFYLAEDQLMVSDICYDEGEEKQKDEVQSAIRSIVQTKDK